MKKLYAPWRSTYTTDTAHTKNEHASKQECDFCIQFAENNDPKHFILKRFTYNAVMLNRYPYNAGHLLVLPFDHIGNLADLKDDVRYELIDLVTHSITILKNVLGAEGINVGLNLGKAAGAGIPAHIHMHVLPRWLGDTNFLPTIGQTKVVSYDLNELYEKLRKAFDELHLR